MTHDCFSKALIAVAAFCILFGSAPAPVCADDLSRTAEIRLPAVSTSANAGSASSAGSPGLPGSTDKASAPLEYRIGRIEVRGNRLISAEKIKSVIKTKEGATYNDDCDQILKDLDAIDDLGYFEPNSLTVVPSERGNNIDLLFVVFEAPVLDSVSIEGSTRLMDAELNAVFEGLIDLPLSHTGVTAAVKKIQTMYVEHSGGFPNSAPVVTARITYSSTDGLAGIRKAKVLNVGPKGPALKTTALKTILLRPRRYRLTLEIKETRAVLLTPRMKAVPTGHFVLPGGSKVFRMWEPTVTNMFYSRKNPRILIAPRKL
ncbi:MAG: outer membrane protein insertion porin family [Cyanobacteriota bacterium erpe_2018_sw_21hr_WHONDRS-SW48-000092_B_bin.40]|jgi:hypothetical protein|nr:outer membrane protein insertion porin family [Cyanobacteriota bacterium erpe_2018_sw_21hr_WHONDRS-SW48-000092_B_bin.40]